MRVDMKGTSKPLVHHWSVCVGAGRANEGLRANWLEQLATSVKECGFKYLRFHGLFHDDMFVYRVRDGKEVFNWQYIDELFDRMLDMGIRPFVELGFCPGDLATETGTVFWWKANGSPPKDYAKWGELVEKFARHCIQRYGLEEVRQWYFEVWNEPCFHYFWKGTRSQYFELYRTSVDAIKKVDAKLRVGGPSAINCVADHRFDGEKEQPGLSAEALKSLNREDLNKLNWRPVWIEEFLEFCAANGLPVDFVSMHPYPVEADIDPNGKWIGRSREASSTAKDLATVRQTVKASKFPDAEIHLTEWSASSDCRDLAHDYPQSATYIVRSNIESSGLANSLSYWAFTDVFEEMGAGDTIFHGGFGLTNFQGIVKPAYHAYRFLHALGDQELGRGPGWIATRRSDGKMAALLYHYPPEYPDAPGMTRKPQGAEAVLASGKPATMELEFSNLPAGAAMAIETVDEDHGFAVRAWQAMGSPEPPDRNQTQLLRKAARDTATRFVRAGDDGLLKLSVTMKPWAVTLIQEL